MYPSAHVISTFSSDHLVIDQVIPSLREQGWEVVQSFNLQSARQAHMGCSCPHHGTEQCDCNMVVFLVYGIDRIPLTLVFHSRDGQVELALVNDPSFPAAQGQINRIQQALVSQITKAS